MYELVNVDTDYDGDVIRWVAVRPATYTSESLNRIVTERYGTDYMKKRPVTPRMIENRKVKREAF